MIYGVASITRGSWTVFHLARQTLRAERRAVLYCPDNGRLTVEGWIVVFKE
jgi:hypothetical protein